MATPADIAPNNERELVLARIMDATPEQLYKVWTTPERFPEWFCPKPWRAEVTAMELRPGGASNNVMFGPDGERFENKGVYLEITPNEKIVFTDAFTETWKPSDKPFMVGIVTFEDLGDGTTRYRAVARHWTAEDKATHEQMGFHEGWGVATDQLTALAKTL